MIAKQSVYLNGDRSAAVAEGDKDARFLLVREGHEVNDAELDKYHGAEKLAGSTRKGPSLDEQRPASEPASSAPKQAKAPRSPRAKASKAKK